MNNYRGPYKRASMDIIKIHYGEGVSPCTSQVALCDAESEIAANSLHANEARCLKEFNHARGIPDYLQDGRYYLTDDDGEVCTYELAEEVDPTPWCTSCDAMKPQHCHCGPIVENN
jgi:hypothetical protein